MPHLHLLVGPNGSGKSTFVREILLPSQPAGVDLRFINADNIAREMPPAEPGHNDYEAMRLAENLRHRMIHTRQSFIAETVFSHESKLELIPLAQRFGFTTHLHVMMVPVELAVQRVRDRVLDGEHDVPEEKIRARYGRLWNNVVAAARIVDVADFYDNTSLDQHFRPCARLLRGEPTGEAVWPSWAPPVLLTLT